MLRGIRLFSLLLLGPGATLYSPQAVAQVLNPTGLDEWDSTNQVLFFGGGSPDLPIRGYTNARQRGADINIFKDFPGLQEFYGTSLTAGPEGTTLFATILNFGGHNIRRVVLTYDSSDQLLKTWDPAPQYAEVIAYSKDDDAIFVLGDRYVPDGRDAPDYPVLVEYSRDGRVLKNMIGEHIEGCRKFLHPERRNWAACTPGHERSHLFLRFCESRSRDVRPQRSRPRISEHQRHCG